MSYEVIYFPRAKIGTTGILQLKMKIMNNYATPSSKGSSKTTQPSTHTRELSGVR